MDEKTPGSSRKLLIAVIIAICAFIGFKVPLHWGLIPAVIGGFSVAVLWWSISRAFAGQE
jgi:hypothetical protein